MKRLNITITKCSGQHYWYKDLIGQKFNVLDNVGRKDYILSEDYDKGHNAIWRHIDKEDTI